MTRNPGNSGSPGQDGRQRSGRPPAWRVLLWGGAGTALLLPLVAMQFSGEMNWSAGDFALFGAMLAVAGVGFELAMRIQGGWAYRAASGVALVTGVLLLWVNAAVGFIGNEDHPVNLAYVGLLAVGFVGGLFVRFQARGLAWVLLFMAVVQAAVMGFAWVFHIAGGLGPSTVGTAVFVGLWLLSAALFRASGRQTPAG